MMKRKKKDVEEAPAEASPESKEQAAGAPAEGTADGGESSSAEDNEKELVELRDRLQRTTAEYENYRKRSEQRRADDRRFTARNLLLELLPIVDNFGAAMKASDLGQDPKTVLVGVQMIHDMLGKFLSDQKVTPINAEGSPFDPALHDAVEVEETDEIDPNQVIRVIQQGYRFDELVIRHARVTVSKAPAGDEAEEAPVDAAGESDESQKED